MAALALAPSPPRPPAPYSLNSKTIAALPETAPTTVSKEGAWAFAVDLFRKNKKMVAAEEKADAMTDRMIEGAASGAAAVAAAFVIPMALEFFPRFKTIGPADGYQVDTEGLIALAALGIGFGTYVMDVDGGDVVFAAGVGLAASYVGSKARKWGASWAQSSGFLAAA